MRSSVVGRSVCLSGIYLSCSYQNLLPYKCTIKISLHNGNVKKGHPRRDRLAGGRMVLGKMLGYRDASENLIICYVIIIIIIIIVTSLLL